MLMSAFFFFQAEDGIRDSSVTGVQTCALPIFGRDRSHHYPVQPGFGRRGQGDQEGGRRAHWSRAGSARAAERDASRHRGTRDAQEISRAKTRRTSGGADGRTKERETRDRQD